MERKQDHVHVADLFQFIETGCNFIYFAWLARMCKLVRSLTKLFFSNFSDTKCLACVSKKIRKNVLIKRLKIWNVYMYFSGQYFSFSEYSFSVYQTSSHHLPVRMWILIRMIMDQVILWKLAKTNQFVVTTSLKKSIYTNVEKHKCVKSVWLVVFKQS